MKLGAILACILAAVATVWLNGDASAQPEGQSAVVVRSLAEIPAVGESDVPYASHVVLIPTHPETRATPEMLAALRSVSDELANASEQNPSGAVFLGVSEIGDFDAAASAHAIDDLNTRYGFGLDRSSGAILLFVHGSLTSAARQDVYARVFESNDTREIAAALRDSRILHRKGIGADAPHSLWELLGLLNVPTTTPRPPHG